MTLTDPKAAMTAAAIATLRADPRAVALAQAELESLQQQNGQARPAATDHESVAGDPE